MSPDLGRLAAALARLLEAFDAQQVRGQSGTITAVVNSLAKAGYSLARMAASFRGRREATAFRTINEAATL